MPLIWSTEFTSMNICKSIIPGPVDIFWLRRGPFMVCFLAIWYKLINDFTKLTVPTNIIEILDFMSSSLCCVKIYNIISYGIVLNADVNQSTGIF